MMRAFFLVVCVMASSAFAVTVPASSNAALGRLGVTTVSPGMQAVTYGSGAIMSGAGAASLTTDASAFINATRTANLMNPSGVPYAVTVASKTAVSKYAPLLAASAKLTPLANLVALVSVANEVGLLITSPTGVAGDVVVAKTDPTKCTSAPCYEYNNPYLAAPNNTAWWPNLKAACDAYIGSPFGGSPVLTAVAVAPQTCTWNSVANGTRSFALPAPRSRTPDPLVTTPSTLQELQDAIAAKSGWPSTSSIAAAVAAASALAPASAVAPTPDSVTVTGPSSSTGPSTTVSNADGSKSVSTPSYQHSYSGQNVGTTSNVTTNNYNTSNVITSTTNVASTPASDPGKNACETNPTSAGCAELGEAPTSDKLSNTDKAVTVVAASFASGGACPSALGFNVAGRSYSISYQPLCDRLYMLKALFLSIAAVLAAFVLADSFKV